LKPAEFSLPKRLALQYERAIHKIVGKVLKPIGPGQTLDSWLADLARRASQRDIQEASELLAKRMCHWVNVTNARTWREAASRSQHSRRLYLLLQRELQQGATGARIATIVRENARLISSIPLEAATVLTREVTKAQQQGARPSTVAKMLRTRWPKLLKSRVNLIARTETAKASAALTRARSEDVGADWYVWMTSEDARVRVSHKKMNDVLFTWTDPPSPEALVGEESTLGKYNVGECPNCRCVSAPLLHADDVTWPRRVYYQGRIQQMTKVKFLAIAGQQVAA
jgi:SPP1 gp7 family putative phage head morphogenesis protein